MPDLRLPFLVTLGLTAGIFGAEFRVKDVASFDDAVKDAAAGDFIVMEGGEWKDADLILRGHGTAEKPITLKAATPGAVTLTGTSRLRLSGEHLVVEGLWFRNALPAKDDIVMFREDSKKPASHSVLRDCAITQDVATTDTKERKWVSLYGSDNRVVRCHFEGKTSKGTLLVVWLPDVIGEPVKHRIAGNYFGPRPRLGKNGGEIIRVGDSEHSMQSAQCVIEGNLFEKCDGEVECISNKSCGNVYRGNTFLECQGTLTMRHGNGCLIEANVIHGNHRKHTGGIRIIGADHRVIGNYLTGIEGDEARAAICLMNGIENSPANGYFQVKRAVIKDNTVLDCANSIVIGYADKDVTAPLAPQDCEFQENYVSSEGRRLIQMMDANAKLHWQGNVMWGAETGIGEQAGIELNTIRMKRAVPPEKTRKDAGPSWQLPVVGSR